MRTLPTKTPIFFRALPKTEDTPTNAQYIRVIDKLPGDIVVHEVLHHGERWKVGDNDFFTLPEALAKTAAKYQEEIERARKPGMKIGEIASALGVSVGTLRKRMGMIRNHLTKAKHEEAKTAN